jgi:Putative prokaryotic signal transducing protein
MPIPDSTRDDRPAADADLVPVFETTEAALLPLASSALEQAGVEHAVQNRGVSDQILGHRSSMTVGETEAPLLIVVRAEDESRARDALRELSTSLITPPVATAAAPVTRSTFAPENGTPSADVEITEAESGAHIGRLTPSQFDSLAAHLEMESTTDDDYYIDEATMAMLEDKGADPAAVALLRRALAGRSDVTIRWRR